MRTMIRSFFTTLWNLPKRWVKAGVIFFLLASVTTSVMVGWIWWFSAKSLKDAEDARAAGETVADFDWWLLMIGAALFVLFLAGLTTLFSALISAWRQARREREFLAMVTHELKSPLATIKLAGQTLLRTRDTTPIQQRFLDAILSETDRLTGLVDNVLDVARAEGREDLMPPPAEAVNLDKVLLHVINEFRPRVELLSGRIKERLNSNARIIAPPQDISRIFGNLLDNAIKYADGPPRIALVTAQQMDQVVITVSDRGRGIDRRDLGRVFRRFERGRRLSSGVPTPNSPSGVGLGLYLVERLVRQAGGMVTAYSAGLGQGATFTIMLPLAPRDPGMARRPPRTPSDIYPALSLGPGFAMVGHGQDGDDEKAD